MATDWFRRVVTAEAAGTVANGATTCGMNAERDATGSAIAEGAGTGGMNAVRGDMIGRA